MRYKGNNNNDDSLLSTGKENFQISKEMKDVERS